MNIVCMGGGPAGLYFGLLMKLSDASHQVTVIERNKPYDTFGWGVVFSDATMSNLRACDPVSAQTISDAFNHWDDIDIHFKGHCMRSSGHGFIGIGRKHLLNILQARCEEVGVKLVFETDIQDDREVARQYDADLVIASDGANSRIRNRYADAFKPDVQLRDCRFVWLGTRKVFDAFTFAFVQTPHGWFQAHAYRFEGGLSTFIVETPDATWRAAGLDQMSQEEGIAYCESLFAPWLDGHGLMNNAKHVRGSAIWIKFPRVICEKWVHWPGGAPVVLMGDAAHTAHFSIGSGTKLALEDAIELAACLAATPEQDMQQALAHYESTRSVEVLKIQNAARNSTEWFENVARYADLPPEQFAYSLLTRSQRISHENLRLRDATWLAHVESQIAQRAGLPEAPGQAPVQPMFTPWTMRSTRLPNRIVVSPMAMYSCIDGVPGDFHLVHLGARALGGAGLVMVEMTCTSPDARITPGCPGLWNDEQMHAFGRIVAFVHGCGSAKIGIQLGHAGRKGSTQVGWEQADHPLPQDNWPLISASAIPYIEGVSQVPRAMTRADMDRVVQDFVASTTRAAQSGFDWLELHCAHGYLLSSFISPLTNRREDEYGGSLENRLRFPLKVFAAVRAEWPEHLPISVRISAHDWVEGGITGDDAVAIARLFKQAGADMIDCSSGQVSPDQRPVYGRMYQAPFADRIRNEAGIATIAVGAITEADQVNSIITSGRADLCALARPHLADASWTLREAARMGVRTPAWPPQYEAGRRQLETLFERAQAPGASS